jgi:hypothetical protein
MFSIILERKLEDLSFPLVALTASWWHNNIYVVEKEDELKNDF